MPKNNIDNHLVDYLAKKSKEDVDLDNLVIAKKNGFENYQDYSYSIYKEFSVNPKMPLNKKYYDKCQRYLLNTLKTFLNYKIIGIPYSIDTKGNKYELTIYSINELVSAIYLRNKDLLDLLDKNNLSINDFIKLVYTTELSKEDENKLGVKRG